LYRFAQTTFFNEFRLEAKLAGDAKLINRDDDDFVALQKSKTTLQPSLLLLRMFLDFMLLYMLNMVMNFDQKIPMW